VIDRAELGALFDGLRASVTIADQDFRISFMNDRAIAFYGEDGGSELIGKNLLDCHNAEQTAVIRDAYARYRAGDLTPTRYYHAQKEDSAPESILHAPLIVEGQFRGIAELIWNERAELVFNN
jgi:PAS domain-containing protein